MPTRKAATAGLYCAALANPMGLLTRLKSVRGPGMKAEARMPMAPAMTARARTARHRGERRFKYSSAYSPNATAFSSA